MYGLKPEDVQHLAHLRGAEVTQVCFGPFDIQFNFHPEESVSVQGRCELLDAAGAVVDEWEGRTRAGAHRFPELLMTPVVDVRIDTPKSFVVRFANQTSLRVVDNSARYESFSVGGFIV